jgi:hypothetical protein
MPLVEKTSNKNAIWKIWVYTVRNHQGGYMHVAHKPLTPLPAIELSPDDKKILAWFRQAAWEIQHQAQGVLYKAKVPEFFNGVRLYRVQGGTAPGSSQGALEIFMKKLEYQGALGKQQMYPLLVQGNTRFLQLTKAELDNLGVGQAEEEEE